MRNKLSGVALTTLLAGALLAGSLVAAPAIAGASVDSEQLAATDDAQHAGIEQPGDAYMGWSLPDEQAPAPQHRSAQAPQARTAQPLVAPQTASIDQGVEGIDVSGWQPNMDWPATWADGKRFAYIKATEGVGFINPKFSDQYTDSYNVGMIRGSYHFGLPHISGGAEQADYFVKNGGNWSADGKTLPGVLDIEYNPYGPKCYNLSKEEMVTWIISFTDRYTKLTGREPVIYTNFDWWNSCTGNSPALANRASLWTARWSSVVGALPGGWQHHAFWQYSDKPIDQNRFNGTYAQLKRFATRARLYSPLHTLPGPDQVRIAGVHRYDTAAKLSAQTHKPNIKNVFIVSGDDFADALSAGPIAGTQRVPLLLVRPDRIPAQVKKELSRLNPDSITVLGGKKAVNSRIMTELGQYTTGHVQRWSGANRYETAAAIAGNSHPQGARTVYIVSGGDFPDGLSGTPAAVQDGAPLLLTSPNRLPHATIGALERLRPNRIVILGGTGAVSTDVEAALTSFAKVTRLAGTNRYETAARIAAAKFPKSASSVVLATGSEFPDALAGGAAASTIPAPLLLTKPKSIPAATRAQIDRLSPDQVVVLGGTSAISKRVTDDIATIWK